MDVLHVLFIFDKEMMWVKVCKNEGAWGMGMLDYVA